LRAAPRRKSCYRTIIVSNLLSGSIMAKSAGAPRRSRSIASLAGVGLVSIVALVASIGGWAAVAKLSSAAVAPGMVVVDSNVKKVQHPSGGVVGQIFVKNGDRVEAGQVVLKLDETITRANLGVITAQLDQLRGRVARLKAERDDSPTITFPADLVSTNEAQAEVISGEQRLFDSRRENRNRQKDQLRERIGQLKQEVEGLKAQQGANEQQTKLIGEELKGVQELYRKNLVPINRVTALQREAARLEGERGSLIAQAARSGGQISEIELQVIGLDQEARTETLKELRDAEAQIAELAERKIAAEDQLRRVDLRAPQAGVVHELQVATVGGVIGPGDVLMQVVPTDEAMAIEVRISPTDIDQMHLGLPVTLRFTAFNQRTTPELNGALSRIAADASSDQRTGQMWFSARVTVAPEEMAKIGHLQLVPGMPVEAHVTTGERTALSYFLKPLTDQFARTFREE
jgi:HlyD family secretion protein